MPSIECIFGCREGNMTSVCISRGASCLPVPLDHLELLLCQLRHRRRLRNRVGCGGHLGLAPLVVVLVRLAPKRDAAIFVVALVDTVVFVAAIGLAFAVLGRFAASADAALVGLVSIGLVTIAAVASVGPMLLSADAWDRELATRNRCWH